VKILDSAIPIPRSRLWLIAGLLIISAVLFVAGTTLERRQHEASEGTFEHEESEEAEENHAAEEGQEAFLGINLENPWLIAATVFASFLLAGLLFRWQRPTLALVILIATAMALLDIRELLFQLERANVVIAILAGIIALAHAGTAVLAGLTLWNRPLPGQLPQRTA
jgi:hypothetical protein